MEVAEHIAELNGAGRRLAAVARAGRRHDDHGQRRGVRRAVHGQRPGTRPLPRAVGPQPAAGLPVAGDASVLGLFLDRVHIR